MKTRALLIAVTVVAAVFASTWSCDAQAAIPISPAAMATIDPTCNAAHEADSRVSASFCSTRLRKQPMAIYADTCGLAEAAAAAGVANARTARDEAQRMLERLDEGDNNQVDPIYRRAVGRCDRYYRMISESYVAARAAIAEQRYGAVQMELSGVASFSHSCDWGFSLTRGARASPFVLYNQDNTQLALLTVAITSLISPSPSPV